MKLSTIQRRGRVTFPEFTGERVYMLPFTKKAGLPFDLARWQPTVDAMLDGVDVAGPIYLMIDQKVVQPGSTHRRPGVHIDGRWVEGSRGWDTGPKWVYAGGHRTDPGRHITNGAAREAIILASSVTGGAAWVGHYEGTCGDGGDFSHLDLDGLREVPMRSGYAWAGDAMNTLHASIPLPCAIQRTLVRLNVPGWLA